MEDLAGVEDNDGPGTSIDAGAFNLYAGVFRRLQSTSSLQVTQRIFCVNDNDRLSAQLCSFMGRQ